MSGDGVTRFCSAPPEVDMATALDQPQQPAVLEAAGVLLDVCFLCFVSFQIIFSTRDSVHDSPSDRFCLFAFTDDKLPIKSKKVFG